jgi:transposase
MSKRTRRNFSPEFKAKVAIEAVREQHTLSELAAKYNIHPNQISEWKKQLLSSSASVFESGKKVDSSLDSEVEKDELYKAIVQSVNSKWRMTG